MNVCECACVSVCQVQESQLSFEIPAVLVYQCMLKPLYNIVRVCVCVCVCVCGVTNNFSPLIPQNLILLLLMLGPIFVNFGGTLKINDRQNV